MTLENSVGEHQVGTKAGAVHPSTPNFQLELDDFRAEAKGCLGEQQALHAFDGGATVNG